MDSYRTDFYPDEHSARRGKVWNIRSWRMKVVPHALSRVLRRAGADGGLKGKYVRTSRTGSKRAFIWHFQNIWRQLNLAVSPPFLRISCTRRRCVKFTLTYLRKILDALWDDNGNIGKRYRRQDELAPHRVLLIFRRWKTHRYRSWAIRRSRGEWRLRSCRYWTKSKLVLRDKDWQK